MTSRGWTTGRTVFRRHRDPAQLRLEELPREARTQIWNLFFAHISRSTTTGGLDVLDGGPWIAGPWHEILKAKHCDFDHAPLDEWDPESSRIRRSLREDIERRPFNKVFDLIEFVLRHPSCPSGFIRQMRRTFTACRLAYTIDAKRPPTILPAATPEEGDAVVEAIQTLRPAGLDGSVVHLRNASACIKDGDWPGSVRESIHAVESVARQLDPKAPKLLKHALAALEHAVRCIRRSRTRSASCTDTRRTNKAFVTRCSTEPTRKWARTRRCSCWAPAPRSPATSGASTWGDSPRERQGVSSRSPSRWNRSPSTPSTRRTSATGTSRRCTSGRRGDRWRRAGRR